MSAFVIAYNSAFEGISLVGPFATQEDALLYAEGDPTHWSIVKIEAPPDDWVNVANANNPDYNQALALLSKVINDWPQFAESKDENISGADAVFWLNDYWNRVNQFLNEE